MREGKQEEKAVKDNAGQDRVLQRPPSSRPSGEAWTTELDRRLDIGKDTGLDGEWTGDGTGF